MITSRTVSELSDYCSNFGHFAFSSHPLGGLGLITNRKSHMGFRLVLNSATLNDLERRNGRVVCVISSNSVAFGTFNCVNVVEDTPTHSASEI